MAEDLEHQAARMVESLLESVGLHAAYVSSADAPVRRPVVSPEVAFARIPPVDRAEHGVLMSRARQLLGGPAKDFRTRLLEFLSVQYGVPAIDLTQLEPSPDALELLPGDVAREHALLPLVLSDGVLVVATPDPSLGAAFDALSRCTGYSVEPVLALLPDLDEALERHYPR